MFKDNSSCVLHKRATHEAMSDMPKTQHLFRRGNVWYLRLRVPVDLVDFLKKKEVQRSLKTGDLATAKLIATRVQAEIEQEFIEARNTLKVIGSQTDELSSLTDAALTGIVASWVERTRLRQRTSAKASLAIQPSFAMEELLVELKTEEHRARAEALGFSEREHHEGLTTAAAMLLKTGISFDRKSQKFLSLGQLFSEAIHAMALDDLKRAQGTVPVSLDAPLSKSPKTLEGPTFREVADEYLNDPGRTVSASTIKNYKIILRAVDEVFGLDRSITDFSRQDAKSIRALLLKIPSNAVKITKTENLKEASEIAAAKGLTLNLPATINMHLQKLGAILEFALTENYISANPARKLSIQDPVSAKEKRDPFDLAQLARIFNSPLYRGCKDDGRNYSKVGPNKPKRARFWVPLIALWSGMRLNEICQLSVADVVVKNSIPIILIRTADDPDNASDVEKRVKTDNGIRFVPVHPMLIKCGFLTFVKTCGEKDQALLFPELPLGARNDRAQEFSKWFSRNITSLNAKTDKTSFHSFRHTYRDAIREAELPYEAALALGGWASKGTDGIYGQGLSTASLAKHIGKIEFPGLDLSHLWVD